MGNNILQYIILFVIVLIRYFLIAGIAFVVFYKLFSKKFSKNKIQGSFPKKEDYIREILQSTQITFIIAGVGLLMLKTPLKAYTKVYENLSDYSLWWIPISVVLAMVVQDTYFYWMHRTVHHPIFFKQIHLLHHKSNNPSPWTSYSFHLFEGILEALIVPIIFILIPMHPIAIILFVFIGFTINVYGHLGYEIAPKWLRHSFLFEMMNTSTHHNMHHAKFKENYGLYFRFWDRLMKTEHPDYVKIYDRIQKRRFGIYMHKSFTLKSTFLFIMAIGIACMMISFKVSKEIKGKWKDNNQGGVLRLYEKVGLYFDLFIEADNPEEKNENRKFGAVFLMKNGNKKRSSE